MVPTYMTWAAALFAVPSTNHLLPIHHPQHKLSPSNFGNSLRPSSTTITSPQPTFSKRSHIDSKLSLLPYRSQSHASYPLPFACVRHHKAVFFYDGPGFWRLKLCHKGLPRDIPSITSSHRWHKHSHRQDITSFHLKAKRFVYLPPISCILRYFRHKVQRNASRMPNRVLLVTAERISSVVVVAKSSAPPNIIFATFVLAFLRLPTHLCNLTSHPPLQFFPHGS